MTDPPNHYHHHQKSTWSLIKQQIYEETNKKNIYEINGKIGTVTEYMMLSVKFFRCDNGIVGLVFFFKCLPDVQKTIYG